MKSRERVLNIINRQSVDRIPVDIWLTDKLFDELCHYYGETDPLQLYRKMGIDKIVWIDVPYNGEFVPKTLKEETVNHWGVRMKPMSAGKEIYLTSIEFPLQHYKSAEQIDDYPWWPDPELFDYDGAIESSKRGSQEFVTLGPWISLFEIYCGLRGFEQALVDLVVDPEFVHRTLDKIEAIQTEMLTRFLSCGSEYLDCVFISDDMGNQSNLTMSIPTWQEFIAPRLARWCRLVHDHGKKVFYHSDGSIEPLIQHLIEAGIDILNPIQHTCQGMNLKDLKSSFGDLLVFHGGIDTQNLLPYGNVDQVRDETRRCLEILGEGNAGYICCSCHTVLKGTPIENIIAMIETVHEMSN